MVWGGVAVVVAVAAVAAVATSGGGSGGSGSATAHEQGSVKMGGVALPTFTSSTADSALGEQMPTLRGVQFDGSPITIKPTGKPQLIVFVAHWCPHCQREIPVLVKLAKAGDFKGIDVTAVATGTNSGYPNYPPSAWLKSVGWPFPVMADSTNYQAAKAFGLAAYPYFVLVNGKGEVVGRSSGEVSEADIIANVKALIAGTPLPLLHPGASTTLS
jgi:cytochrome c biogenesis protein CcmG/thiol:disulfide interchange protein DsbE